MVALARVSDIADWLHPAASVWKALAMLRAYFDESGTHGDAPITVIAGFVATAEVWAALEAEWSKLLSPLAELGVTWFHLVDCQHGRKQFDRVRREIREDLIANLADVVSRHDVSAVWAGVNVEEFDRLATPEFRQRFPKPYDLCFDEVVRQIWWWSRHNAQGERVPLMFAVQEEYEKRNIQAYQAWRAHPRAGELLGSLTFDFPKNVVPLQAADFIAGETAKEWTGREYGEMSLRTGFQLNPTLQKITQRRAMHAGGLFSTEGLKTAIARFMTSGEI